MAETLEQKAEEARQRFDKQYGKALRASGYFFSSYISKVGVQEFANRKIMKGKEGNKPCIVAYLSPAFDTVFCDLDYMRRFTIKPEFEGLKVYVTGTDNKKDWREDPLILGRD